MFLKESDIIHVHTFRCGHAENIADEAYIQKAIKLGASGIWFTDHAPFPGDPFQNRMKYSELDEYIRTLDNLKKQYQNIIDVHIGFEIEYFPSFEKKGYYNKLRSYREIEMLLLGQHMAELESGVYTFSWDKERLNREEYVALGEAELSGICSGFFDAVAHPDRIYRRQNKWTSRMEMMAKQIVDAARKHNLPLEQNVASKSHKQYREEFWLLASGVDVFTGIDAHSLDDLLSFRQIIHPFTHYSPLTHAAYCATM